jgi:antitoxin (DNA-binding transcriptional repressor) of toxin-antitoxin stability system
MERLQYLELAADFDAVCRRVHESGQVLIITSRHSDRAIVKLAAAGPYSPGRRVTLSEARKQPQRLAEGVARSGEPVVMTFRGKPLARFVPLAWTGDGPEPERDPKLWAQINARIDRYFANRRPGDYSERQQEAIRAMAAPVAYDLHTTVTLHGFAAHDFETDFTEIAIWAAASKVR